MLDALQRRAIDDHGQTTSEYRLGLTLITIGCIAALAALAASGVNVITRAAGLVL